VERLTGIDASFLYMETPTLHMHTIKVAVLEPAPGVDYSIERVTADLRERLHLLPPFRRRVIEVPLGFHHPVWIEDPAFDLDRHVRRTIVPPPGGPRELDAVISRIASAPLDRRCPLWELWYVGCRSPSHRARGCWATHSATTDERFVACRRSSGARCITCVPSRGGGTRRP